MRGLGLTQAVQGYARGREWRQDQDDRALKQEEAAKQKALSDQAGQAWKQAMTPAMIEVDAGVDDDGNPMPKIAQPDPKWDRKKAVVKGFGAVADVYAKAGDMERFMKAEAAAAPLRAELRTGAIDQALAQYKADKNPVNLAQAVYPHIYDGNEIKNAVTRGGKIELTMSDGKKLVTTPEELEEQVNYFRDPKAAAEYEAKARWEMFKGKVDTEGKIAVEKTKGAVEKDVEKVKQENRLGLATVEGKQREREIGLRTSGELKTIGARGAEDRKTNAAKPGEGARQSASKVDWTKRARESFGPQVNGMLGGTRISDERMVALAASARDVYEANPNISEEAALLAAAEAMGIKSGGVER